VLAITERSAIPISQTPAQNVRRFLASEEEDSTL